MDGKKASLGEFRQFYSFINIIYQFNRLGDFSLDKADNRQLDQLVNIHCSIHSTLVTSLALDTKLRPWLSKPL